MILCLVAMHTIAATLFATPLSVALFKERLTARAMLGMALCVVGVWLVTVK